MKFDTPEQSEFLLCVRRIAEDLATEGSLNIAESILREGLNVARTVCGADDHETVGFVRYLAYSLEATGFYTGRVTLPRGCKLHESIFGSGA